MTAVLLGLSAALSWGIADIFTRQTGRSLGSQCSLLVAMLTGFTGFGLWLLLAEHRLPWPVSGWTLASSGLAALATLLLYEAMRRGPLSLASPAVSAYPAWTVLLSVLLLGLRPGPLTLLAMLLTLAGVLILARFTPEDPSGTEPSATPADAAALEAVAGGSSRRDPLTLPCALGASLLYGAALLISQNFAVERDGMSPLLWWTRVFGMALALPPLLLGAVPRPVLRTGPVLLATLQGGLDAAGIILLLLAGNGLDGALATVVSSAFTVVTVVLARIFFHERVNAGQLAGIAAVVCGIVGLGLTSLPAAALP